MQTQNAAVSAIQFALETDDGLAFLRCWNEGNFEAIRSEWPEAPESVFAGADRLTLQLLFDQGTIRWTSGHAEASMQSNHRFAVQLSKQGSHENYRRGH